MPMNVPIREAAQVLDVSIDTVRRRIRTGSLRAERDDGGRWIVELADDQLPFRIARFGQNAASDTGDRMMSEMVDVLREQLNARTEEVKVLTGVVESLTVQCAAVMESVIAALEQNRKLIERALSKR